ncbi:hypothetical protein HID58_004176 [Brassica napus]|uniref:Guanosine nucleotide diphosphate dissociation inhibitor n=1 Tax=Brassica napus TaxID=3708 RepID=A0ABQ8E7T1_BRANA|nr:hypothetical protein HID58_004176 [Brassica napus]
MRSFETMDEEYDVIVLGTGLKECILSGLLSVDGLKVLHMDRNDYYGGESSSLNLTQLWKRFRGSDTPQENLGAIREYNVDMIPKFIMANGTLVQTLIHTDVTKYLNFKAVDGSFVYKKGKIYKVPATDVEALKSPLMGLFEKRRARKFFIYVQDYDEKDPKSHEGLDLSKVTAREIISKYGLEDDTIDFIGHALALHNDDGYLDQPAMDFVMRIKVKCLLSSSTRQCSDLNLIFGYVVKLYAESLARFQGGSPYIYPLYGLGELPQAFARLSAVYGGTYMLNKPECKVEFDSSGKAIGVTSAGETAKCKKVVCDPSYLSDKVKKVGKVNRAVCIMSHPIPETNDAHSVQIILPQKQLGRKSDMYLFCCSYAHNVAPKGKYIAFVSAEAETDSPEEELKPGIELLGPIDEIFYHSYDTYVPTNKQEEDNCFISGTYDATTHFESTVEDVLEMYTKITGKTLDLSVDLSAANTFLSSIFLVTILPIYSLFDLGCKNVLIIHHLFIAQNLPKCLENDTKKDPLLLLPPPPLARLLELKALHLALVHHLQAGALLVVVVADLLLALDQQLHTAHLFILKDLLHVLQATVHLLRLFYYKDLLHALQATLHLLRLRFSSWISASHDSHSSENTSNDHGFFSRGRSSSSDDDYDFFRRRRRSSSDDEGMFSGFIDEIKDAIENYRTSKKDPVAAAAEVASTSGSIACVTQAKAFQDMISRRYLPSYKLRFSAARSFRSDAALEAISNALEEKVPNLVLYNYPSFSGAFSALFAHLYHSRLRLPSLILPFSSVVPFSVKDLSLEGFERCYLLDFIPPKDFVATRDCEYSAASKLGSVKKRFKVNVDVDKSSSKAVYEYFSSKLASSELLRISSEDLIANGSSYFSSRLIDAKRVLKQNKAFKIRLGRGFYGECMAIRADGNHELSDELGKLLSLQSAAAGLRPIGAVTFMQRNNLKMCLRSTDDTTDTSEVAKAYGGGGTTCSSSFIIRMDEYNEWTAKNPT